LLSFLVHRKVNEAKEFVPGTFFLFLLSAADLPCFGVEVVGGVVECGEDGCFEVPLYEVAQGGYGIPNGGGCFGV